MATADDTAIANRALTMIGEETITGLTQDVKRARAANTIFSPVRMSVLQLHGWQDVRKYATLVQDGPHDLEAASWTGGVATFTTEDDPHTIAVGNSVTVSDVTPTGYNGTFEVATVPGTDTFTVAIATDPSGSGTAFGEVSVAPNWGLAKQYALPSDFIRMVHLNDRHTQFQIQGSKFLTDESSVKIEYVYNETDTSVFGPALTEAFAAKLALELSYRLDTSTSKQRELQARFLETLSTGRNIDAAQRNDDYLVTDGWLNARLTNTQIPWKKIVV